MTNYKTTMEDYKKLTEEQAKVLKLLGKKNREKSNKITKLNLEIRHLKRVIKNMETNLK